MRHPGDDAMQIQRLNNSFVYLILGATLLVQMFMLKLQIATIYILICKLSAKLLFVWLFSQNLHTKQKRSVVSRFYYGFIMQTEKIMRDKNWKHLRIHT